LEGLEALRLLASGSATLPVGVPIAFDTTQAAVPLGQIPSSGDAWDQALLSSRVSDLIGSVSTFSVDTTSVDSGISQLDRYMTRTWYRAGIAPQQHDDCTQAVYASLLTTLGPDKFQSLVAEVGQFGIRDVLSRETPEGPDFFRAIDTVKKRAQRERVFQPIDNLDVADTGSSSSSVEWSKTLREAIDQSLSPREAALINATLQGQTPAEIAQQWGVAPKTISNEKSRVIQKLRDVLVGEDGSI
jgi:RNA polymerase sigma factor (sigma-70 family)